MLTKLLFEAVNKRGNMNSLFVQFTKKRKSPEDNQVSHDHILEGVRMNIHVFVHM
jgi:hypothetical protein